MAGISTLTWAFTALVSLATSALGAGPDTRGVAAYQVARDRAALAVDWDGCGVLDAPAFATTGGAIVATQHVGGTCTNPPRWRIVAYVSDGLGPGASTLSYLAVDRATGVAFPPDDLSFRIDDTFGAGARIDSVQPQPAFAGEPLEARFCLSDDILSHRVEVTGATIRIDLELSFFATDPPTCNFGVPLGSLPAGRYTIVVVPKCCEIFEFDQQTYELTVLPARTVPALGGAGAAALVVLLAALGFGHRPRPLDDRVGTFQLSSVGRTARAARCPPL